MAAELAAFAVASATLHPMILPGYMLGAVANRVAAWWGESQDFLHVSHRLCRCCDGHQTKSLRKNEATIQGGQGPAFIYKEDRALASLPGFHF